MNNDTLYANIELSTSDQWVTLDGRVLAVKDMSDSHIDNTIKFLASRIKYLDLWKQRMIAEKNYRLPWWRYIWETLC